MLHLHVKIFVIMKLHINNDNAASLSKPKPQRVLKAMFVPEGVPFDRHKLYGNLYYDEVTVEGDRTSMYIKGNPACNWSLQPCRTIDGDLLQAPFAGVMYDEDDELYYIDEAYFDEVEYPERVYLEDDFDIAEAVEIWTPQVAMPEFNDEYVEVPVTPYLINDTLSCAWEWVRKHPGCRLVFFR